MSKVVQIAVNHGGQVFALASDGAIYERVRSNKDFNQGPHSVETWTWREIELPPGADRMKEVFAEHERERLKAK